MSRTVPGSSCATVDTTSDEEQGADMSWQKVIVTLGQLAFWSLVVLACCTPVFGQAWCGR